MSEIKRENVKDFFRWAFLNTKDYDTKHDQELEQYITEFEEMSGLRLEPGRGSADCMTLTVRPVDMLHRSLVWYFVSLCLTVLRLEKSVLIPENSVSPSSMAWFVGSCFTIHSTSTGHPSLKLF